MANRQKGGGNKRRRLHDDLFDSIESRRWRTAPEAECFPGQERTHPLIYTNSTMHTSLSKAVRQRSALIIADFP